MDTRDFIVALGGYRLVAGRLGKGRTTVHTHMQSGVLPAAWYNALCTLALEKGVEQPSRALFSFLSMEGVEGEGGAVSRDAPEEAAA